MHLSDVGSQGRKIMSGGDEGASQARHGNARQRTSQAKHPFFQCVRALNAADERKAQGHQHKDGSTALEYARHLYR